MEIFTLFQAFLDEKSHRAAQIDRWWHFSYPGIRSIAIPTLDLASQRLGSTIAHALSYQMVAPCQEPAKLFIAARTTIQAPNCPTTLGR